MKTLAASVTIALVLLASAVIAFAQAEVTVKGTVTLVDLKMKTLVVATYDGKETTITIDDRGLKKFGKGVIKEGDEITVKCIVENGKLRSVSFFRKPPG
jgi:phage/plasmid primase-like uncharacterized protein